MPRSPANIPARQDEREGVRRETRWGPVRRETGFALRGGVSGTQRIARHVWRICLAPFVATGSFFIGQQKVKPAFMHGSPILFALGLAPLALMIFWLVRVRFAACTQATRLPHRTHRT